MATYETDVDLLIQDEEIVPKSASVTIWMTPEERDRLRAAAERAGLGLGPWLLELARSEADRASH
jgi:hypothetical protein